MRKCHVFDGAISFVFSFARLFCPHSGAKYACALRYFAAAQYASAAVLCAHCVARIRTAPARGGSATHIRRTPLCHIVDLCDFLCTCKKSLIFWR